MSIGIFRYDINGKHVVLSESNKPLEFETEEQAKDFLRERGVDESYIDLLTIRELTKDELTDTYESEVEHE